MFKKIESSQIFYLPHFSGTFGKFKKYPPKNFSYLNYYAPPPPKAPKFDPHLQTSKGHKLTKIWNFLFQKEILLYK